MLQHCGDPVPEDLESPDQTLPGVAVLKGGEYNFVSVARLIPKAHRAEQTLLLPLQQGYTE